MTCRPPFIERAQWSAHPHYPHQVLLLGSHENFRALSTFIRESIGRAEPLAPIRSLFDQWMGAMRGHEAYEERKLYPYLEARFGLSMEDLAADHRSLHVLESAVQEAFRSAESRTGSPGAVALGDVYEAYHRALSAHLDAEEERVIPLLLALSPQEFRRYYNGSIGGLLRELAASPPKSCGPSACAASGVCS